MIALFDNTGDILEEFARKYPNLKIVTIKPDLIIILMVEKFALMVGIKGAEHDLLVSYRCRL